MLPGDSAAILRQRSGALSIGQPPSAMIYKATQSASRSKSRENTWAPASAPDRVNEPFVLYPP